MKEVGFGLTGIAQEMVDFGLGLTAWNGGRCFLVWNIFYPTIGYVGCGMANFRKGHKNKKKRKNIFLPVFEKETAKRKKERKKEEEENDGFP
jgi:hypothetical protein